MLQWYCKHTLELASLEKKASKLQGVLIMPLVNLNSSSLCCFTMVAKHTDVIHTWFCILSTKTSFMFAPNSILVSTLPSQGRHCTSSLCIRCTTSQWLLYQLCGTLVSTLRRKEKDEVDTVLIKLREKEMRQKSMNKFQDWGHLCINCNWNKNRIRTNWIEKLKTK